MTRLVHLSLVLATTSLLFSPMGASAQTKCAAGLAANGNCANEAAARAAVRTAVIFSQPKISTTAYPVLPSSDRLYRYPNQLTTTPFIPPPVGPGPLPAIGSGGGSGSGGSGGVVVGGGGGGGVGGSGSVTVGGGGGVGGSGSSGGGGGG
jgi:hypothetical protein